MSNKNRAYHTADLVIDSYMVLHPAAREAVNRCRQTYRNAVLIGQALCMQSLHATLVGAFGRVYGTTLATLEQLVPEINDALAGEHPICIAPSSKRESRDVLQLGIWINDEEIMQVSSYGTPNLFPVEFVVATARYGVDTFEGYQQFPRLKDIRHVCLGSLNRWKELREQAQDVLNGKR